MSSKDEPEKLRNSVNVQCEAKAFTPFAPEGRRIGFDQVGGMEGFKELARMKIITPFRHPELFRKFKKKAGGGILLYGPPGCGKTFLARAIAGECGSAFFNVGIDDVLDMYVGNSEKNVAALFEAARRHMPAVVFIDEIDALGRRRDLTRYSAVSTVVNTFLSEMDGLDTGNEHILVIGATNAVWDVDNAFKRPGRFDRVLFVPPPDENGRRQILKLALSGIPAEAIDLDRLARATQQFSGADLTSLVDRATEVVLEEILRTGRERKLTSRDLSQVLEGMRPSTREWLEIASNYVEYGNETGQYDELRQFLDNHRGQRKRVGFMG